MDTFNLCANPVDAFAIEAGYRRQATVPMVGVPFVVGAPLKIYMRRGNTSYGRLVKEARCAEALRIRIERDTARLYVDGALQDDQVLHDMAQRGGFGDGHHFAVNLLNQGVGRDFEGWCIRW